MKAYAIYSGFYSRGRDEEILAIWLDKDQALECLMKYAAKLEPYNDYFSSHPLRENYYTDGFQFIYMHGIYLNSHSIDQELFKE